MATPSQFQRAPIAADELSDPDGDGIPNLLEFATGGDPNSPNPHAGLPRTRSIANGRIEWTFLRRKSLTATQLSPQGSDDLSFWQTLPAGKLDSTVTESSYDTNFQQVVVSVPLSTAHYFFRLSATQSASGSPTSNQIIR